MLKQYVIIWYISSHKSVLLLLLLLLVVSAVAVAGGQEPVLALAVVAVAVLALSATVAELLAWKIQIRIRRHLLDIRWIRTGNRRHGKIQIRIWKKKILICAGNRRNRKGVNSILLQTVLKFHGRRKRKRKRNCVKEKYVVSVCFVCSKVRANYLRMMLLKQGLFHPLLPLLFEPPDVNPTVWRGRGGKEKPRCKEKEIQAAQPSPRIPTPFSALGGMGNVIEGVSSPRRNFANAVFSLFFFCTAKVHISTSQTAWSKLPRWKGRKNGFVWRF